MTSLEQSQIFPASDLACLDALQIVFSNLKMSFAPAATARSVLCHWSPSSNTRFVMEAICFPAQTGSTTVRLVYRPGLAPLSERPLGATHVVKERMASVMSQLEACLDSVNHPDYPRQVVESFRQPLPSRADRAQEFQGRMLRGLLLVVFGVVATAIGFGAASSGGTYLVFWGAIAFGAIDLLAGLVGWLANS